MAIVTGSEFIPFHTKISLKFGNDSLMWPNLAIFVGKITQMMLNYNRINKDSIWRQQMIVITMGCQPNKSAIERELFVGEILVFILNRSFVFGWMNLKDATIALEQLHVYSQDEFIQDDSAKLRIHRRIDCL